jgi:hypothetical protein
MSYGISLFRAATSQLEAENSEFMAEKSHLLAEISRLTAENSFVMSKNKLVQTMNDSLRIKQGRDAEKISNLENRIALVQPSAKNISDTEKIHGLKSELDAMFQANEYSNNLLDIAKKDLKESNKKNKELQERSKDLEKYLGYHIDFEDLEKKITEMQLKDHTDFKNSKKSFLEWPQLKPHPESEHPQKQIEWHIKRLEDVKKTGEKNSVKLSEHGDFDSWVKKREAAALESLSMLDPAVD